MSVTERTKSERHILVVTYWSFSDALIQTYTLPYLRMILAALPAGSRVHLVTLEKDGGRDPYEAEPGLQVHPFRYVPFGARALGMFLQVVISCLGTIRRYRVDTIHAMCTPAGMIAHVLSVLTRLPLILDSYEPHAEAMVENGSWNRNGVAFRVLFRSERWQSHRARILIAAASGMEHYALEKYGVAGKPFLVKPACVDLERFSLRDRKDPIKLKELGLEGKLVAVYAGKFGGIYLDQDVFDLFGIAHGIWGDRFHVLLLTAHSPIELLPFMKRSGLTESMFTIRFVPHVEVPKFMGLGDFAITPVRSVPTKRFCTPIKNGEYWALGLPVLITPGISDDSRIISEHGIGAVLEGLDPVSYKKALLLMETLLASGDMEALYARIRPIAEKYRNFALAQAIYRTIYGGTK